MSNLIVFTFFGKEYLLLNDSFIIYTVFSLLFLLFLRTASPLLRAYFESTREQIQQESKTNFLELTSFQHLYQSNLSLLIALNFNRDLLVPSLTDDIVD